MADTAFRDWQIDQLMPASPGHKDAWQILWGLFTQHEQQRQDQLCRDLLQLPAASVNQYLLQYVYLAVSRPSAPLERAIVELCGRSFNLAVQVQLIQPSGSWCSCIMPICGSVSHITVVAPTQALQAPKTAEAAACCVTVQLQISALYAGGQSSVVPCYECMSFVKVSILCYPSMPGSSRD
eukprot:GHUV01025622.1.p1 GENE.GHUV01025622.1~~GHUV01025622.1.p1  ORF type:complete len:181 (+),score=32.50 GHUV01025622.1:165-707(+)